MLRPALRSRRSAVLVRRRVRDLVPPYRIVVFAVVTELGTAALVANFFLPVDGGRESAGALRIRTARVAVGAGLLLGWSFGSVGFTGLEEMLFAWSDAEPPPLLRVVDGARDPVSAALFLASVFSWALLVSPRGKLRLVEANR